MLRSILAIKNYNYFKLSLFAAVNIVLLADCVVNTQQKGHCHNNLIRTRHQHRISMQYIIIRAY